MRTDPIDFDYYERRLDALRHLPTASATVTLAELGALAERLMYDVAPSLELEQVEKEINAAEDLDIQSLFDAASMLENLNLSDIPISAERKISVGEELSNLRELLVQLQDQQRTLHLQDTWVRLEWLADRHVFHLLLCAARIDADVSPLVQRARQKLQHLSEVDLVRLWARVQGEFQPDRTLPSMPADASAVPPNFLNLGAREELAEKLAHYAFSIKPRVVVARFAEGIYSYPLESMGPARMLALNINGATIGREVRTVDIARAISRLSAMWGTLFGRQVTELADILGIAANSRLLMGTQVKDTSKVFSSVPAAEKPALAIYELQHFILIVQRYSHPSSPLHQALNQYKLGLEVTLPESATELQGKGELRLQKELCRFLLERGIYSEGTKFGPFETDLLAQVSAQAYILEVKLVTESSPPSPAMIKAGLAQLQDYMDKRLVRPRGILIIYNLSNTLITGPGTWLRGRYWITAINLGSDTGSRRRRSLTIEEHRGLELVTITQVDAIPTAKAASKTVTRAKTAKKRSPR